LHTHNRIDILFKYALRKSDIHLHTFHSAYLNNNFLYKFLKPEKSVSISMTVKRYLNRYNIDNQMIYNGVDVHTSQKHFRPKQLEAPKLLYVGRLSEEKGFDKLLKALLVYKYNGTNQIQFDVVGDGVNIESYKNIVESSEGSLKVNFKGYIPNPWDNINEYDILVIPSYFEGFCLVAAEGASLGIPIVGNNILALREVLSFLPDSNFFDIHDPNSIHITITECLTNILGQRTLALDNTAKITDKFSKKRMLLNYLKAYESFS
jgi:glycosyltransferase involved in cell wall biosynthesis